MAVKAPLTAEQIDFKVEPEVLTQDYTSKDGHLELTVIDYPTPQIAGERLRALQSSASNPAVAAQRSAAGRRDRSNRQQCRQGSC